MAYVKGVQSKTPKPFSSAPAGKELRSWLDTHNITYALFGQLVGYKPSVVARFVAGYCRPKWIEWLKIEYLTGIPWNHWLTDTEREEVHTAKLAIDRLRRARPVKPLT